MRGIRWGIRLVWFGEFFLFRRGLICVSCAGFANDDDTVLGSMPRTCCSIRSRQSRGRFSRCRLARTTSSRLSRSVMLLMLRRMC